MKLSIEDIVGGRSDSCRAAFEKVAYAAERHSEQTPAHDQLRTILRSGECHDLVELINFQALKIKELLAEIYQLERDAGETEIQKRRLEKDRDKSY